MKQIQQKIKNNRYPAEDENFWSQHITAFSESKISRKAYCKRNSINYDRFGYWIRKLSSADLTNSQPTDLEITSMHQLLPVQLKSSPEPQVQNIPILCTLNLSNGAKLQIHHEQALVLIIEKWS